LGAGRHWHFFFAWLLLFNGVVYLLHGFWHRHFPTEQHQRQQYEDHQQIAEFLQRVIAPRRFTAGEAQPPTARTVHFVTATLLVLFVLVHVVMVLVSGVFNNLRSMITIEPAADRVILRQLIATAQQRRAGAGQRAQQQAATRSVWRPSDGAHGALCHRHAAGAVCAGACGDGAGVRGLIEPAADRVILRQLIATAQQRRAGAGQRAQQQAVLVHVVMVLVSGVFNNLRSMITGRYAIDKEDTPSSAGDRVNPLSSISGSSMKITSR
jgi:hypothetical protein